MCCYEVPITGCYERRPFGHVVRSCGNLDFLYKVMESAKSHKDVDYFISDEDVEPYMKSLFDLVVSNLSLDVVNDLPGLLLNIFSSLKESGVFIGVIIGGETLKELRYMLQIMDEEAFGRVYPRVMPHINVKSIAALMQNSGFSRVVSDVNRVTGLYRSSQDLMMDVKKAGKGNCLEGYKAPYFTPTYIEKLDAIYKLHYGEVKATFDLISFSGEK